MLGEVQWLSTVPPDFFIFSSLGYVALASNEAGGSQSRLQWETPCKTLVGGSQLGAKGSANQCVEDELPNNAQPRREVPLRGTFFDIQLDQAARVFDSLAWSFSLKCLYEAINVFDVSDFNMGQMITVSFNNQMLFRKMPVKIKNCVFFFVLSMTCTNFG